MRNSDPDLLLAVETYGRGARFFSARSLIAFVVVIVFALIGGTTWFLLDSDEPVETVFEAEPESFFTSSLTGDVAQGYDFYEGLEARPMPFCGSGALPAYSNCHFSKTGPSNPVGAQAGGIAQ